MECNPNHREAHLEGQEHHYLDSVGGANDLHLEYLGNFRNVPHQNHT